jgi:hypothetical protein
MHFTGDLAGNPLSDLGDGVRRAEDRKLRMPKHVDEAGRHHLVFRVDDPSASQSRRTRPDI